MICAAGIAGAGLCMLCHSLFASISRPGANPESLTQDRKPRPDDMIRLMSSKKELPFAFVLSYIAIHSLSSSQALIQNVLTNLIFLGLLMPI